VRLGESDQIFTYLEKASANCGWMKTTLNADPLFDDLRSDPRFADLLRGVGLPQ